MLTLHNACAKLMANDTAQEYKYPFIRLSCHDIGKIGIIIAEPEK